MSTPALDPSAYSLRLQKPDGTIQTIFEPLPGPQVEFCAAQELNVFLVGNRGGGKSWTARNWCHMEALAHPGLIYVIVRKSYQDLNLNHLIFLPDEMATFGGDYNKQEHLCRYPNGSIGVYRQCASLEDVKKVVGAQAAIIVFDEAPELEFEWLRLIGVSVRVKKNAGYKPKVRYLGNPIGNSIDQLWSYFIDKDVDLLKDREYRPADWKAIEIRLEDNEHLDVEEYKKQFAGIPDHFKKAWLDGVRVVEGQYFSIDPKTHFTTEYVDLHNALVYRSVDWGSVQDPAVCLWIAVQPSGRAIAFKERTWHHVPAKQVAEAILRESAGMRIIQTFCDPTMMAPEGLDLQYAGNIFEANGLPLTKSKNDRTAAGFAISEWLQTPLADGKPKLQIYVSDAPGMGCPMLAKTLPLMRMDPKNPGRIADGNDHYVIGLGYWCMALTAAPHIVNHQPLPGSMSEEATWRIRALMNSVSRPPVRRLGSESVRTRRRR